MQCIKTGATIQINADTWVKGDLYQFGEVFIMKYVFYCIEEPVDWMDKCHAQFKSWQNWWHGTDFGGHSDRGVIFLDKPSWFEYDGRTLSKG